MQPMHSVVSALRSPCEIQKAPIDVEYGPSAPHEVELDVQVHVEQSVIIDYDQSSRKRLTGA